MKFKYSELGRYQIRTRYYRGFLRNFIAAAGLRVSGMKKQRMIFTRSAWTLSGLDCRAGSARSGSSAKSVGAGPLRMSESKQSQLRGQAARQMTGRLSLQKEKN